MRFRCGYLRDEESKIRPGWPQAVIAVSILWRGQHHQFDAYERDSSGLYNPGRVRVYDSDDYDGEMLDRLFADAKLIECDDRGVPVLAVPRMVDIVSTGGT